MLVLKLLLLPTFGLKPAMSLQPFLDIHTYTHVGMLLIMYTILDIFLGRVCLWRKSGDSKVLLALVQSFSPLKLQKSDEIEKVYSKGCQRIMKGFGLPVYL